MEYGAPSILCKMFKFMLRGALFVKSVKRLMLDSVGKKLEIWAQPLPPNVFTSFSYPNAQFNLVVLYIDP